MSSTSSKGSRISKGPCVAARSLLQFRQSGCRNALPNSLEVVVGCVELDVRVLGEFFFQDFLSGVKHHAAKDHHVVDLVELAVLCQCIAQVHAHSLVKLAHLLCLFRICHVLLDQLQTLCVSLVFDCAHVLVWVNVV